MIDIIAIAVMCALANRLRGGGLVRLPDWFPRKVTATLIIGSMALAHSLVGN